MKTIETIVYNFDELSKEAQQKAIKIERENNDYMFLSDTDNFIASGYTFTIDGKMKNA